jgi:hypothetical protein
MWRNRFGGGFGPVVRQNTEWIMLKLIHLKTLQHVSISIQIIFRKLIISPLKSLDLICFKIIKGPLLVIWQHNCKLILKKYIINILGNNMLEGF